MAKLQKFLSPKQQSAMVEPSDGDGNDAETPADEAKEAKASAKNAKPNAKPSLAAMIRMAPRKKHL